MKVVKKLLAPVLVVGLLLTSLVTLHHLKDAKKRQCLSDWDFPVHHS